MREGNLTTSGAAPIASRQGHVLIEAALEAARDYLEMSAAYLSEFEGEDAVIRYVDRSDRAPWMQAGDRHPLHHTYCHYILEGRLPPIIPDTAALVLCRTMPVTVALGIGSLASVPVRRSDGSIYGMFCCFSPDPHPTLNPRDLKVLRMFAAQAEEQIVHNLLHDALLDDAASRVRAMLNSRAFDIVYQPIYRLDNGSLASFEALTRFRSNPYRTPDRWFADAAVTGMQADLEVMVIEKALTGLADLPQDVRLSVNASSDTVSSGRLLTPFDRFGPARITLEITEHDRSADARALRRSIEALRAGGALMAIDDVGAGYSGLHQILKLRPDILKLDMSLVRDIDRDPARRALAAAMVSFAAGTGAHLTAEGIERLEEYDVLRDLGIDYGQGWLLGRPGPIAAAAGPWIVPQMAAGRPSESPDIRSAEPALSPARVAPGAPRGDARNPLPRGSSTA